KTGMVAAEAAAALLQRVRSSLGQRAAGLSVTVARDVHRLAAGAELALGVDGRAGCAAALIGRPMSPHAVAAGALGGGALCRARRDERKAGLDPDQTTGRRSTRPSQPVI